MPARSEAQRRLLNAKFGHAWVVRHGFDNSGPLPARVRKRKPKVKKRKPAGKKKKPAKKPTKAKKKTMPRY